MQKFKCNVCGRVYELKIDAVYCHPDITQVWEGDSPDRAAEHRNEAVAVGQSCPSCDGSGYYQHNIHRGKCLKCNGTGQL